MIQMSFAQLELVIDVAVLRKEGAALQTALEEQTMIHYTTKALPTKRALSIIHSKYTSSGTESYTTRRKEEEGSLY